jgi:hypothetical protein
MRSFRRTPAARRLDSRTSASAAAWARPAVLAALAAGLLAGCASSVPAQAGSNTQAAVLQVSPECQAARLRAADPMPVALIPEDVLRKAQSGYVAVRYDVVEGRARNPVVVASQPAGLYDAYVLRHAAAYTEPTGATVRGCIMTTSITF